jgi:hypothetical protein
MLIAVCDCVRCVVLCVVCCIRIHAVCGSVLQSAYGYVRQCGSVRGSVRGSMRLSGCARGSVRLSSSEHIFK